jgi:glycine cleavage system H protein
MKEIDELILEDVHYTKDHEWARPDETLITAGISDYAQDQLGEVVYVELPEVGERFEQAEAFGTVESVKAVSELYMPVGGEVVEINERLEEMPDLVNKDPYGDGWMIRIKPDDPDQLDTLMEKDVYLEHLKGIES